MRGTIAALLAAVIALSACGSSQSPRSSAPSATAVAVAPVESRPPTGVAPLPVQPAERTQHPTGAPPSREPTVETPAPSVEPPASPEPPQSPEPSPTPKPTRPPRTPAPQEPGEPVDVSAWNYEYSMYRPKTHSVQRTDWYCVPTTIQMMFNVIRGESDRSMAGQTTYWRYAQQQSTYPLRDNGADPGGWVAAMKNWGAQSYSVGVSGSMQAALRLAAKRMRLTGLPVGLIVWGDSGTGGHAWVMTGFRSTADPKLTDDYTVSSVQAMGSLWPYGTINGKPFDPGPKEWVGYGELRRKFVRFDYPLAPAWDGRWITVLP